MHNSDSGNGAISYCIESCTAVWTDEPYLFGHLVASSPGGHPTRSHQNQTHLGRETQGPSLEAVAQLSLDQTTYFADETPLLNPKCGVLKTGVGGIKLKTPSVTCFLRSSPTCNVHAWE